MNTAPKLTNGLTRSQKARINAVCNRAYGSRSDNAGRHKVRGLASLLVQELKTLNYQGRGQDWESVNAWERLQILARGGALGERVYTDLFQDSKGDKVRHPRSNARDALAWRLAPAGVPRWVRIYDNGGETADRYTVVFTGQAAPMRGKGSPTQYPYLGMSSAPFHPQGFGQHGHTTGSPADYQRSDRGGGRSYAWPPKVGRKCHLGTRIKYQDLPEQCRRCLWQTYADIWDIPQPLKF